MQPDTYLVIDFEATCCDKESFPREHMEIIEIGAVLVNAKSFDIMNEFQSFIHPVRHPVLTSFCTQLTSIQQADVDNAPTFNEAIESLKQWLHHYPSYLFCSWGNYDLKQLEQDSHFHGAPYPLKAGHRNLRQLFTERQQLAKKPGLNAAIQLAGLTFTGTPHRGIDDARNIARLLPFIFGDAQLPHEK